MYNAVRRMMGITCGVVWGWALAAGAQTAGDPSGVYEKDGAGLVIVQGSNETLVRYEAGFPQGESVGTCDCAFVVGSKSASRWTLSGADAEGEWSLRLVPGSIVLEGSGQGCCGAGWPGSDTFSRAAVKPLATCQVKGARVVFHASDAANTARKAYVVAGDKVEAVIPDSEPALVPARFKGSKVTAGLLERTQLECAAPGGVKAEQLQPFAGTWVSLTKKGKGYVISKPCSAETPSFTLDPSTAQMDIQLGQESTRVQVTKLTPGAGAGAWSLELTGGNGGAREQVEWKVTDAAKGLVTLRGSQLFAKSRVYVRGDKKSAYPVEAEKGCDEYE